MKRALVGVAVVGLLGVVGGCSSEPLAGEVVSKKFEPEHSYTYMQPQYYSSCSGTGTSRICTQQISTYIPITMTDPACYRLYVVDSDGKKRDGCVPAADWEKAKKGDDYAEKG